MKNQFVTYEIALKLKELGFGKKCFAYYYNPTGLHIGDSGYSFSNGFITPAHVENICQDDIACIAPLWQQVIDWLREIYKIHILIQRVIGNRGTDIESESWTFEGTVWKSWPTYYKAREQSILKALELITNK